MYNRRFIILPLVLGTLLAATVPLHAKSADGLQLHLKKISRALAESDGNPLQRDLIVKSADYIGKHLPAALANAEVGSADRPAADTPSENEANAGSRSREGAAADHTGGEIQSALSSDEPAPAPLHLTEPQWKGLINAYSVYSVALVKAAKEGAGGVGRIKSAVQALRQYLIGLDKLGQLPSDSAEYRELVKSLAEDAAKFHG